MPAAVDDLATFGTTAACTFGTTRRPGGDGAAQLSSAQATGEEVHERASGALRLVVPDEVPGVGEHEQLGAVELPVEAVGHLHACEPILLAPHDQGGHTQGDEPAVVGDELLEVAGAVELEVREAPPIVGERLPVLI